MAELIGEGEEEWALGQTADKSTLQEIVAANATVRALRPVYDQVVRLRNDDGHGSRIVAKNRGPSMATKRILVVITEQDL